MKKIPKQEYTAEFKEQAVKHAQAVGIVVAAKSDGVLCEGCAVKYAWINAQRREYPLPDMCEVLAVSISGYRAWRRGGKPDRTRLTDPQAVALMNSIHAEVRAAYGSRRMHRELRAEAIASACVGSSG